MIMIPTNFQSVQGNSLQIHGGECGFKRLTYLLISAIMHRRGIIYIQDDAVYDKDSFDIPENYKVWN